MPLTRLARGSGSGSIGSVARSYVAASGGARGAALGARAGRASTSRLGSFLADGLRNGFAAAAEHLGLTDLVGRPARFLLARLVDVLAPVGALREEGIARTAMIQTLAELFETQAVESDGLGALDALNSAGAERAIRLYIVNYVNARFQHELGNCIERGATSEQAANRLMSQIKGYIAARVRMDLGRRSVVNIDWRGVPGRQIVDRIFQDAYSLIGRAS